MLKFVGLLELLANKDQRCRGEEQRGTALGKGIPLEFWTWLLNFWGLARNSFKFYRDLESLFYAAMIHETVPLNPIDSWPVIFKERGNQRQRKAHDIEIAALNSRIQRAAWP